MIHGKLLPVVPRSCEGEDQNKTSPKAENVLRLLEKYYPYLADTVVCFEQTTQMVEAILATGKKVVPCIIGDRKELTLQWNDSEDEEWVNWVRWVLDNVDRFEGVQLGNIILEVTNYFCPEEPTADVVYRVIDKFPTLVGKLILAPFHHPDVHADTVTEGWPLRRALRKAGPWHTMYWGYKFLTNPPPKLADWLYEFPMYSGVNYSAGAADHNLNKLMSIGFAGGLFFLPVHSRRDVADRRMEQYLTDIPQ